MCCRTSKSALRLQPIFCPVVGSLVMVWACDICPSLSISNEWQLMRNLHRAVLSGPAFVTCSMVLQTTKAGCGGLGTRLITSIVVLPSLDCHSIVLHYITQNLKTKEIFTFRGHANFVYFVTYCQYSSLPQLLRIGFDEEKSQLDTKNLLQQIINICHPSHIT